MAIPGLNGDGEGGVVQSNAFNLTRVSSAVAYFIGVFTALDAAVNNNNSTPEERLGWGGFDQGQRLIILVAVIAAVSIIHSSDMFARAIATARVAESATFPFAFARRATKNQNGADPIGWVVAVRSGDGQLLFYNPQAGTVEWLAESGLSWVQPA